MKALGQPPRPQRNFFTHEPKFSVAIAILSIVVLLVVVYHMRSAEQGSLFCSLPDSFLCTVKQMLLHHQGV